MSRLYRSSTAIVAMSSLCARLASLAVVVAAAHSFSRESFDIVVYTLATTSAVQILLDPATSNFVVVEWPKLSQAARESLWKGGLQLQFVVAAFSVPASILLICAVSQSRDAIELAAALSSLAAAEGIARYTRAKWQAADRFTAYAAVDGFIMIGRLLVAVVAAGTGSAAAVAASAVAVSLALLAACLFALGRCRVKALPVRVVIRRVWPYGISTVFSSLYAQAPPVLMGIAGDLRAAAVYSVASRITQPMELVPNALAAVYLPRLARVTGISRRAVFRAQARSAAAMGVVLAVCIAALAPWVLGVLGLTFREGGLTLLILAAVLPVKFLNYQLVCSALADGRVRQRLAASAFVALVSITAVALVSSVGASAVAFATLGCELLLSLLLTVVARQRPVVGEAVWG